MPSNHLLLCHTLLLLPSIFPSISSVQFSQSVVSDSLKPYELQHARPPCPSPTPGVYSNSCPLSRPCLPTISSSVVPFSCHRQSFPASVQFSSVAQSCPTLCDPMDCSLPGSLSITNSQSLLKLMSIELVMPSSHLILCHPLLLLPSIFPSIRVFSNESALHIRWPKYWSFSFNISPSNGW